MPQTKAQLASSWGEFATAMKAPDTECPGEFANTEEAITYLRSVLGDDYLDDVRQIRKHPFRQLMFVSWPGLRSEFLDWIAHVRRVKECVNTEKLLCDLRIPSKSVHAYGVLRLAGRLRRRGFGVAFEPDLGTDSRLRPDARIDFASTDEDFFLEFSGQWLAERQLNGFEAMAACSQPVNKYFETLKHAFRLRKIPAPQHMEDIVHRIEAAVDRVRLTGRLAEVIDEGTLEMAICGLLDTEELEAWCSKHGLRPNGLEGPRDETNHLEMLKKRSGPSRDSFRASIQIFLRLKITTYSLTVPSPASSLSCRRKSIDTRILRFSSSKEHTAQAERIPPSNSGLGNTDLTVGSVRGMWEIPCFA
jgi:hypothetical protein